MCVSGGNVAVADCRVLDNAYRNAVYNWLSAEVLAGHTPTERSDIYSYAVIVWEILHGWHCMTLVFIHCTLSRILSFPCLFTHPEPTTRFTAIIQVNLH